jgi:hypothetical protein
VSLNFSLSSCFYSSCFEPDLLQDGKSNSYHTGLCFPPGVVLAAGTEVTLFQRVVRRLLYDTCNSEQVCSPTEVRTGVEGTKHVPGDRLTWPRVFVRYRGLSRQVELPYFNIGNGRFLAHLCVSSSRHLLSFFIRHNYLTADKEKKRVDSWMVHWWWKGTRKLESVSRSYRIYFKYPWNRLRLPHVPERDTVKLSAATLQQDTQGLFPPLPPLQRMSPSARPQRSEQRAMRRFYSGVTGGSSS